MKTYITSDLHLMHKSICGPDAFVNVRKQFADEVEMTEYLIKTHNEVVRKGDITYNLGDLSLNTKPKVVFDLLSRMNGRFIIVKGNHDSVKVLKYLMNNNYELPSGGMKFEVHEVGLRIKRNGKSYHMTHYPLYIGHLRNNLRSIHGHIHQTGSAHANHFNICIDSPEIPVGHKYGAPLLLNDVIDILEAKVLKGQEAQELYVAENFANPNQLQLDL